MLDERTLLWIAFSSPLRFPRSAFFTSYLLLQIPKLFSRRGRCLLVSIAFTGAFLIPPRLVILCEFRVSGSSRWSPGPHDLRISLGVFDSVQSLSKWPHSEHFLHCKINRTSIYVPRSIGPLCCPWESLFLYHPRPWPPPPRSGVWAFLFEHSGLSSSTWYVVLTQAGDFP